MKKILFLICVLCSAWVAAESISDLRSAIILQEDNSLRYSFFYNDDNTLRLMLVEQQDPSGEWLYTERQEWKYSMGRVLSVMNETYQDDQWIEHWSDVYQYDGVQLQQRVFYDTQTNYRHTIKYNYNLMFPSELVHTVTTEQSISYTEYFNYNLIGQLLSYEVHTPATQWKVEVQNLTSQHTVHLLQQQINGQWVNDMRFSSFYDYNRRQLQRQTVEQWNATKQAWEPKQKTQYAYENSLLSTATYSAWTSMFYKEQMQQTYQYDARRNLVQSVTYLPFYRKWRPMNEITYQRYISFYPQFSENAPSFWGDEYQIYQDVLIPHPFTENLNLHTWRGHHIAFATADSGEGLDNITNMSLRVSPNPSNGIFVVDWPKEKVLSWQVVDVYGKTICQGTDTNSSMLDLTAIPAAVYFLIVKTNNQIYTSKLIKQ